MSGISKTLLWLFLFAMCQELEAQQELPISVRNALDYRRVPHHTLSAYVERIDTEEVTLAWNEAVPRNPASVEKMLTTLVALDVLGAAYTWKTDVYPIGDTSDGVL